VLAAGRSESMLGRLRELGADGLVRLDQPVEELRAALGREAGDSGVDVVIDYLWGAPTEAVIAALSRRGLTHAAPRVRLVQVGESAGPTITLPADVLRSSGLEIYGSGAGTVPMRRILEAIPEFLAQAAADALRVAVDVVSLADVQSAWHRGRAGVPRPGRRRRAPAGRRRGPPG
jgi:NADPH2:quinone reductase